MQYLGNRGAALILALLIMTILTILGISISMKTNTNIIISKNYKCTNEAFYGAEAGINEGMVYLNNNALNTWDDELTSGEIISTTYIGENNAKYTVSVTDNNDSTTTTSSVDEDGIVLLTSMLTYSGNNCKNTKKQIDMKIKNNATNISQKHYKEDNVGLASTERGSVANTKRATF